MRNFDIMAADISKPATTIILPTQRKTPVVEEVISQLSEKDELLVACDSEQDAVADSDFDSEQVRIIVAGEPEGCSGKANAIYHGMKAAENNRIVWTDDDFNHPEDWLEQMHKDCNRYGAVSELPFFIGKNPLSLISEPIYSFVMLVTYLNNQAWGGSVMFDRDSFDEEKFLEELKTTIGDDVLLSEHLDSKTVRRTHRVEIDETSRDALERITRFVKNVRYHEPLQTAILSLTSAVLAFGCIAYPLPSFLTSTLGFFGIYRFLGENRFSFMFGYIALLLLPLLLLYGLLRQTFVWHGRRYKYNSKLDIEIIDN